MTRAFPFAEVMAELRDGGATDSGSAWRFPRADTLESCFLAKVRIEKADSATTVPQKHPKHNHTRLPEENSLLSDIYIVFFDPAQVFIGVKF